MCEVSRNEKTALCLAADGGFLISTYQPHKRTHEECMNIIHSSSEMSISKNDKLASDIAQDITRSQNSQTISKHIDMVCGVAL